MILPICEVYLLTKRIFSNEIQLILLLQLFIRSWLGSKRWIYLSDRISYVLDVYNYILSCEHDRYIIPLIYVFSMVRFIHQFHSINSYCFSRSAVAYWYCLEISKIQFNGNSSFSERYSITIYTKWWHTNNFQNTCFYLKRDAAILGWYCIFFSVEYTNRIKNYIIWLKYAQNVIVSF